MKKILLLLFIATLWSCGSKPAAENSVDTSTPQLTKQQIAEGWKLLFDGKSLTGWRIFKDRKNNSWEVIDGTLHCKAPMETAGAENERSDIMTVEQYENFELSLEWKVAAESNSGIMFRVTEEFEQPYFTGPEYQLIDDVGYPGELKDDTKTGSNYGMHVAENKKLNPAGEWNQTKIVVNQNHVEYWLNGTKVVEYDLGSEDWINRKNASKWKDVASYGVPTKGHIDLQDHGGEVWFRNIMIKVL